MPTDPVFLIGTERSGSNLLRVIVNAHPRIVMPHPPHVVWFFAPLEARYGDLSNPLQFRALVDDILALLHTHIHPWPWVPTAEDLIARARTRDVFGVYVALHEALRDHVGKARWGCKSTFMIEHVPRILEAFPGARLVWLHRDPRDVAASSRDSVFSTFHPAYTAQLWARQQALGQAAERLAPANVLRLRYESLVGEPEAQVRRLCAWLEEDFAPEMMHYFKGEEAKRSASLSESWAQTGSPIRTASRERWRTDLRPAEIAAVEAIAAPAMDALGYALSTDPATFRAGAWTRAGWWVADRAAWLRVEARSLRKDRNVGRRWRRAMLMRRIRRRLGA